MLFFKILFALALLGVVVGLIMRKHHHKTPAWFMFLAAAVIVVVVGVLSYTQQNADTRKQVTKFVQDYGYTLDGSPSKVGSCSANKYLYTGNVWEVPVTTGKGAHQTLCVFKTVGGNWSQRVMDKAK
jgi:uncharacterized membrane protein YeiB